MHKTETKKKIQYRLLGKSGIRVFPLCLGNMTFGDQKKENFFCKLGITTSFENAEKIVLRYIKAGGNFFDTANFYHDGESEEVLGRIIEKNAIDRDSLVIATKYCAPMSKKDPNKQGIHKKNLVQSVNDCLKRLRMDYIDIMYIHVWDWSADIEALTHDLDCIVRTGKVLHIAISDAPAWVVSHFNVYAKDHGLSSFICYQGKFNLCERGIENILTMCSYEKLGFIPFSILGEGKLTGKHISKEKKTETKRVGVKMSEKEIEIFKVVNEIAEKRKVSPSQVAINWTINFSGVTSALIGVRTVEQLEDNLKALDFQLTKEEIEKLNKVSKTPPSFPFDMCGTNVENSPIANLEGQNYLLRS